MRWTTRITDRPQRRLAVCLLLYVVTGTGSVALTAGQAVVAPLYLAAGVAAACVLAWGPTMAWAVGAGCALVELYARLASGQSLTPELLIPSGVTGLGATGQALLAGLAGRRWLTPGPALERPREIIGMLLLAGPLACTVNAALSVGVMVLRGELAPELALSTALDWWYGDAIGVLIGTPLTLTLIGEPAALWRTRRRWVGLPMLLITALTVLLLRQEQVWDQQRADVALERDSASVLHHAQTTLRHHQQALDSLWLLQRDDGPRPDPRFAALAAHWQTTLPAVGAFSLDERTTEAQPGTAGGTIERLQVREVRTRHDAQDARTTAATAAATAAATHRAMVGQDALTLPALRAAWSRAVGEGQAAASAGLPLPQGRAVIVYRALGTPAPGGALVMVLETEPLLRTLVDSAPADLLACLSDLGLERSLPLRRGLADAAPLPATALAGPPGCSESRPWRDAPHRLLELSFGGRSWQLALWRDPAAMARAAQADPSRRLPALGGLLLAAAAGALLLTMTGQARRLQAAMAEARTGRRQAEAAMQAHSAFLSRVSHELRTPLHAMLGLGALMRVDRQHPPDAWQDRTLQQMDAAGQELLRAVDALLDASRAAPSARPSSTADGRPPVTSGSPETDRQAP